MNNQRWKMGVWRRRLLGISIGCFLVSAVFFGLLLRALAVESRHENVKLVRIVDGDTVRLDIELSPRLWLLDERCRLLRINAPERNTSAGQRSRRALGQFLHGKKLAVEIRARDAFGRLLIELWADQENASDWMLATGQARKR